MLRFISKNIGVALFQIVLVATFVFLLLRFIPGDPAQLVLGSETATDPAAVEAMRATLGLDKPLMTQYITWVFDIIHLDFGKSLFNNMEVSSYLSERLPRTLELAIAAIIIGSLIGIPLGIIASVKRGSFIDVVVSSISAIGMSFPVYVSGTVIILIVSLQLQLLPASGYTNFSENPVLHIQRLILPAITIALPFAATVARMTRSSMLEVLNKEFVQTLRAKGLSEKLVIYKHVLRNAIMTVITVIGLELGSLIGGTVLIEFLFNWPGLSSLLVESINNRNYPVIQGVVIVIATSFILINRSVEIIYGLIDPRTR